MTNKEKLREVFPNTLFLYQKDTKNRIVAILCSDEWLDSEYNEQKEEEEKIMKHYRQGREDERAIQKGELMQSFNPD